MAITKTYIHDWVYYVLLIVLVVAIPTSNFLMSFGQIFLALNWVIEGHWSEKLERAKKNYLLWAFGGLFILHIVWLIFTSNFDYALDDLRKKLPLLILPLVLLTSKPIEAKRIDILFAIYCCVMGIVSIYSWINHFINPILNYRELFPFISHIRLALNTCLVIFLLLRFINGLRHNLSSKTYKTKSGILLLSLAVVWFLGYLFLLQSYTGFIILLVTFIVIGVIRLKEVKKKIIKISFILGGVVVLMCGIFVLFTYVNDYYTLKPLSEAPLKVQTVNGNLYEHRQDGFIECGNYVNNYICRDELKTEWEKISTKTLDIETPNGYPIEPALIRYLNSKGLTKDSVGVSCLTTDDVKAIENGKSTVYEAYNKTIPQMIYRMLFEIENYRHYSTIKNSSMLQRVELWQNTWEIFLHNPIFGVGTGDVADDIKNNLQKRDSELKDSNMRTHNQYLTFLLTFGIVGLSVIIILFAYAIYKQRLCSSILFVAYLCIVMLSFLSEDTLETAAGCLFSTFFFLLFSIKKGDSTAL